MLLASRVKSRSRVLLLGVLREQISKRGLTIQAQWEFAREFYEALSLPSTEKDSNHVPACYARKDAVLLLLHYYVHARGARYYESHFGVPHNTFCKLIHFVWKKTGGFAEKFIIPFSFASRQEGAASYFAAGNVHGTPFAPYF